MENSPLFIVGPSRSGSTLLSRLIDEHSQIAILPETWMFSTLHRLGCNSEFRSTWQYILFLNEVYEYIHRFDYESTAALLDVATKIPSFKGSTRSIISTFGKLYAEQRGARIWGEKTPNHLFTLPSLAINFENAKYVRIARDPRDILASFVSSFNSGKTDINFLARSAGMVKHYFWHLLYNDFWSGTHPYIQNTPMISLSNNSILIRYEDLTASPELVLKNICKFINVPFETQMLSSFYKSSVSKRISHIEKHKNLTKPISTKSVGRFMHIFNEDQISAIEEFFGPELRDLQYEPVAPHRRSISHYKMIKRFSLSYRMYRYGLVSLLRKTRGCTKVLTYMLMGRKASSFCSINLAVTRADWESRAKALERLMESEPKDRDFSSCL